MISLNDDKLNEIARIRKELGDAIEKAYKTIK